MQRASGDERVLVRADECVELRRESQRENLREDLGEEVNEAYVSVIAEAASVRALR